MKKTALILSTLFIVIFALSCKKSSNSNISLKNLKDSASYSIGLNVAQSIKNEGTQEINVEVLAQAMKQVMENDSNYLITEEKASMVIRDYFMSIKNKKFEKNLTASKEFLEKKQKK